MEKTPHEISKTEVIIELLEETFAAKEAKRADILNDIDSVFSVENKVFMPRNIYKKLLTKSDYTVDKEITDGAVDSAKVADIDFIIMEACIDTNAIMVEMLVQKKSIEILKKRITVLEKEE
jgi:hypothetical protein